MYDKDELEKTGESIDFKNAPKTKKEADALGYSEEE